MLHEPGGSPLPRITIVIPTTCERERWTTLRRAIACVLAQTGVDADVLAVVNGQRYDADCLAALRTMTGVTVHYRSEGSAPLAQLAGRELLDSPYFGFLDDDDEYLPGALAARVAPMLDDPALDFVVTNGYRAGPDGDSLTIGNVAEIRRDPLLALCTQNWMGSCSGLFRSASVGPAYFADPAQYMEWTYLAFRLTARLSMRFLDLPTYRVHDTPRSLSKSSAYLRSELDILQRVLVLSLPEHAVQPLRVKLGRALHTASEHSRAAGDLRLAWKYHRASLALPGGWRYLLYSRRLVGAWMRKPSPAST
ncbi:glycosyltransferase family 2 protein [Massilia sp. HP4]|uniref:glycosyltransferase family 2 protein n=1 Tax=Massilia sp. HP4 TaxID=2562316 RepID=UPI0010C02983|nr:glycosyltransferase family 2 protein [Massilia sp. HP4]